MKTNRTTLRAAWLIPVTSPPIPNGAVRIENGRITWLGPASEIAGEPMTDLGNTALLPGFVNCHTHLELTAYANLLPPAPLWDWLNGMIQLRRQPGAAAAEIDAVRRGAQLSLAAGVTCVGDISRTGLSFEGLLDSPIRKVCFFELISGAGDPPRDPDELRQAAEAFSNKVRRNPIQFQSRDREGAVRAMGAHIEPLPHGRGSEKENLTIGFSPHAPYTVSWNDLRRVVALAAEQDAPITMHFCETQDEREWLTQRTGRLAEFLAQYPILDPLILPRGQPLDLLHRAGMTRLRPLLAHANYVSDEEIADMARAGCSVAYCPRAHRFFGHKNHRWRDMLAAGVNVCAATDSLASNQSLSILDELRFLHREAPEIPADSLLAMGTLNPARALGLQDDCGSIQPGRWADLTAIPLHGPSCADPVSDILDASASPLQTWLAGMHQL